MDESAFFTIWRRFQGKQDEDTLAVCPIAQQFLAKLEEMVFTPLSLTGERGPTRGQVAQAKYLLQEEYQAWKKSVPQPHLRYVGGKHRCLFEVYDEAYDRLHLFDLRLRPMLNLILDYDQLSTSALQQPQQPPAHRIQSIFLGEDDE